MSRSRTSICTGSALLALLVVAALAGCNKKAAIAELTKADGPVEREEPAKDWAPAAVGTKYFLGDAARTADGGAQLSLGGSARIAMQPHTVLRFGGKAGNAKIAVELGAIDLSGTGSYGLDVGDVKLAQNGSIRITAKGQGKSEIELLVGQAQIAQVDGKVVDLQLGKAFDMGIGAVQVTTVADAGVADAPAPVDAAAAPDAAPVDTSGGAQIEVVGKKAEIQEPGATTWKPLPAGAGTIAKGTKLRLGAGTTAKLVGGDTTLELAGGSRMTIGSDLVFGMELGSAKASVAPSHEGSVGVPGGAVALKGTPQSPAEARVDIDAKGGAKVTVLRGGAKLTGAGGAELDMNRGESASLAKAGAVHPLEAIPTYFDMKVNAGDPASFTVHDPKGATALQFAFAGKCPNGGVVEIDRDNRFRTARVSAGKEAANLMVPAGTWSYRIRCTVGGDEGAPVVSGRVSVVHDAGQRPLPKDPPINPIDADGRTYRISYQSLVPTIKIKYAGSGSAFKLHMATGGADETYESSTPSFTVPGSKLKEATYTYWVDHDGTKQDKVSTLIINFDQTAPQVYIESPPNGQPFGAELDVRGAVLPGWSAKVDVVEIPVDTHTRRFAAKVPPPPGNALAIRLAHPQRGVHFYLRRGTK